jgi:hypothetical protein
MIETIKLVGRVAGLLTAAFTAWDRLVRGRPLAYIVVKGKGDPYFYLRVINVGRVRIVIIRVKTSGAKLAKDHELESIVRGTMGGAPTALLDPGESRDFVLMKGEVTQKDRPIWFRISWRRTSSIWLPLPSKVVRTNTADLRLLSDAFKNGQH